MTAEARMTPGEAGSCSLCAEMGKASSVIGKVDYMTGGEQSPEAGSDRNGKGPLLSAPCQMTTN